MKFEHESWRKLYVAESIEHRLLPIFTRSLRDYLLRMADDEGTLLKQTKAPSADLARVLIVDVTERKQFDSAVTRLLEIEYLTLTRGRLYITRFVDAQAARTPGALRQKRYRERHQNQASDEREASRGDVTRDVTLDETRDDETRDDPPTPVTLELAPDPDPAPQKLSGNFELHPAALAELANFCGQSPEVIRVAVDEFRGYWLIGAGAGKKRTHWQAKCRGDVLRKHESGALIAIAKRIGTAPDPENSGKVASVDDVMAMMGAS